MKDFSGVTATTLGFSSLEIKDCLSSFLELSVGFSVTNNQKLTKIMLLIMPAVIRIYWKLNIFNKLP